MTAPSPATPVDLQVCNQDARVSQEPTASVTTPVGSSSRGPNAGTPKHFQKAQSLPVYSSEQTTNGEDMDSESADGVVQMRNAPRRELRHAFSEFTDDTTRRRTQSMAEVKIQAYQRLQTELGKAQEELKLKDEEVDKLLKVRDQMGEELEELTAALFEEANNMVQDANVKRMHSEKLQHEANQKIEVLQAELTALKQLVLTSTPSTPNPHLNPQIDHASSKKEKEKSTSLKPFWKTHRRSTSHHEFTMEARELAEAEQDAKKDRCKEIDSVVLEQFQSWRGRPEMNSTSPFMSRLLQEDIGPCLNFNNKNLSERVQNCVETNTLTIEPVPGDSSYPRRCCLSGSNKLCNYKVKLGEEQEWYSISQFCRNRIAAVCDFYTYIRYILQGLVKSEDKEVFYEVARLRKRMALARLGYS